MQRGSTLVVYNSGHNTLSISVLEFENFIPQLEFLDSARDQRSYLAHYGLRKGMLALLFSKESEVK